MSSTLCWSLVAEAVSLMQLGTISLDGIKIQANASRNKVLKWEYAILSEEQLKGEVEAFSPLGG